MPNPQDSPAPHVLMAVPVPLRETFLYRWKGSVPPETGQLVRVPFGSRKLTGVVTNTNPDASDLPDSRIREIDTLLDVPRRLPASIMRLCRWAADYYHHPVGEVFAAAIPRLIRDGSYRFEPPKRLALTADGRAIEPESLARAPVRKQAVELLANADLTRKELADQAVSARTIKVLIDKGWAHWVDAPAGQPGGTAPTFAPGPALTGEQSAAVSAIDATGVFLLDGVTGSGKTEVYLRVIDKRLRQGQQVLIMVPEIGLTPQTVRRFESRFDFPVQVFHSSASDRERADTWYLAGSGQAQIVLGTRSAIFIPFRQLGAIIVDEEHDASYKQQDGFRYSARDLAVLRGQFEQVPVVLGSATPSLESLHNCEQGKYHHLRLTTRPPGINPETYELLDTRHLEKTDGFTRRLKARIRETLEAGNQALVFLNRRGYAPVLICNDCGWIANCRRCDARLTYHLASRSLVCHHCGNTSHNIISCQSCQSQQVAAVGIGTERVEQTLQQLFPEFPVIRIDRDSTRRKGAMAKMIERIREGEPAILVGTQLLAKGHHFPAVTLVAILDIDSGFYSTDFRATERAGQLIVQVGGRAGRADRPGRVLVQTEFATNRLLKDLVNEGYAAFASDLLAERRSAELPPYTFQALLRAEAKDSRTARTFLEHIARKSSPPDSVALLGPLPALMEKRAGRYRQLLVVMSDRRQQLHRELDRLVHAASNATDAKKVRWALDVDPVDLF